MPELPDVAILKRYFDSTALHQPIERTTIPDKRILQDVTPQKLYQRLKGAAFQATRRRGKYLFADLGDPGWLVLHFGMTGNLAYYGDADYRPEYAVFVLDFANGRHLAMICARMLGAVSFTEDPGTFAEAHDLGPDALEGDLDATRFAEQVRSRNGAIKPLLMNQSFVAGIGNVYADEILFQSHIHPKTTADDLDVSQAKSLFRRMRRVLQTAIDRDADARDLPRTWLITHRADGEDCPRCGGSIARIAVSGRGTYLCPGCQG